MATVTLDIASIDSQDHGRPGKWGGVIDDEVLSAFAVVGPLDTIASQIKARYGDVVTRVRFATPNSVAPDWWAEISEELRAQ